IITLPKQEINKANNMSDFSEQESEIIYEVLEKIGIGAFGRVYKISMSVEKKVYAMKRVLQDTSVKNRELDILKKLKHKNTIAVYYYFYNNHNGKQFLNIIMDFMPKNLSDLIKEYLERNRLIPLLWSKVFIFQIAKSLAYIHNLNICHRDVKPDNILLDSVNGHLKLADFGSAKILEKNERSVTYICSRSYRSPELIFGNEHYGVEIDSSKQMFEIIKIIGTPNIEEIEAMNPKFRNRISNKVDKIPWRYIFPSYLPEEALSLPESLLVYNPHKRVKAINLLSFKFFDEIYNGDAKLPNGNPLPNGLFSFSTIGKFLYDTFNNFRILWSK
ncbi:MAG: Glycogen synthase kinase-3 beta, partial [Paramarteilia canceri]